MSEMSSSGGKLYLSCKRSVEGLELPGGIVASDEEFAHFDRCLKSAERPSTTVLQGAALLKVGGITKPHYRLDTIGFIYDAATGVFAGYLKWGGWYDISGCAFYRKPA